MDKRSSLLRTLINYVSGKIYNIGPRKGVAPVKVENVLEGVEGLEGVVVGVLNKVHLK